MNRIDVIAPLLRGLSWDGDKGSIIVSEDDFGAIGFSAPPDPAALRIDGLLAVSAAPFSGREGAEETLELLSSAWQDYLRRHGSGPQTVVVEGVAAFGLGADFDSALANLQSLTGVERPLVRGCCGRACSPGGRADVVRNKIVVVTGGAQGFGRGLVENMAGLGAQLVIADLNEEGAASFAAELNRAAGRTVAHALPVDVGSEESVAGMVRAVVRRLGGIDVFISNAGVLKAGGVREMSLEDFSAVTSVNYTGFFLCVKHAAAVMALQNRACGGYFTDIIQINSKSGLEGSNRNAAYSGGKFGGLGLTQSFALELVSDNIKVNAVCPGNYFDGPLWSDPQRGLFVQYLKAGKVPGARSVADVKSFYEDKVPMKRGCTPEDVARAVCYIIEQRYETGQAVPVTGGQIMLR